MDEQNCESKEEGLIIAKGIDESEIEQLVPE